MSVDFLDSNVFLYLFDEVNATKRAVAETLIRSAIADGTGIISFQVVQETLNTLTRGKVVAATPDDARRFLDDVLTPLLRVNPSPSLYQRGLDLQSRYRYSFYDSLIICSALESGCSQLLSEDLQDGQRIEGLTI